MTRAYVYMKISEYPPPLPCGLIMCSDDNFDILLQILVLRTSIVFRTEMQHATSALRQNTHRLLVHKWASA